MTDSVSQDGLGIPAVLVLTWTVCLAISMSLDRNTPVSLIVPSVVMVLSCAYLRTGKPVVLAFRWAMPFCVPVFLIHAVLLPIHPVTLHLWGTVPLRSEGVHVAASVMYLLAPLICMGLLWRFADPDELLDTLAYFRVPTFVTNTVAQALGIFVLLHRRIGAVYTAQKAKGIPVGPGIALRLLAILRVAVPAAVATLNEVEPRAAIMALRGFGSGDGPRGRLKIGRVNVVYLAISAATMVAQVVALHLLRH